MAVITSARILLGLALVVVAWQSLVPSDQAMVQTSADKLGHGIAYLVLGFLAALALRRGRPAAAWAGLLGFGLAIEVAQGLGGTRSFEWLDLLADAVGAWLGIVLGLRLRLRRAVPDV